MVYLMHDVKDLEQIHLNLRKTFPCALIRSYHDSNIEGLQKGKQASHLFDGIVRITLSIEDFHFFDKLTTTQILEARMFPRLIYGRDNRYSFRSLSYLTCTHSKGPKINALQKWTPIRRRKQKENMNSIWRLRQCQFVCYYTSHSTSKWTSMEVFIIV